MNISSFVEKKDFSWAWENNTELAANAGNFTSQLVTIINSFGTTTPTPIHELCETYYEVIRGEVAIVMLIPAVSIFTSYQFIFFYEYSTKHNYRVLFF